jgi:tRNA threonylcarbamoyl adenosine modification protein YeaZ
VFVVIDTSAGTSVAVVSSTGARLSEASTPGTMRHAEVIGSLLSEALSEANVAPSDLTAVVAGMGPGPFTGLRVGIAAARVFALGAGIPVIPAVSHDAVAQAQALLGVTGRIVVVTDARRKESFFSRYQLTDGTATRIEGPALAKIDDVPVGEDRRVDAAEISAAALGASVVAAEVSGAARIPDEAIYLRSPDVTLSAGPKRVTQ